MRSSAVTRRRHGATHAWVPMLAPLLPLPIPVPQRLGEPSKRFPWPWIVTTWVPGEPADRAPATRGAAAADALAAFLSALHQPAPAGAPSGAGRGGPLAAVRGPAGAPPPPAALPPSLSALHQPAPAGAPSGEGRGGPLAELRDPAGALTEAADLGLILDPAAVRAVWDDALTAPAWEGPPTWLHGDLHPANVLTADGTFCGVIDL